jgi:hypothetical protein
MSDDTRDLFEQICTSPFLPERIVCITTRSGRKFRFDVTEYRVFPDSTTAEVDRLAHQIFAEKYRSCEWDRKHPNVNVQAEIFQEVVEFLSNLVEKQKQHRAKRLSQGKEPTVGPLKPSLTVTFSTNKARSKMRQAVPRTRMVWGVFDHSLKLIERFDYPCRREAEEFAAHLTSQKRILHFVQGVKEQIVESDQEQE